MKTRLKKSLSVLLTLAMLFSTLSSSIVAVGDPIIPQPDYAPIPDVLPIEEASEPELPPPLPAVDGSIAPDDLLDSDYVQTNSPDIGNFLSDMTITSTDGKVEYYKDGKIVKEFVEGNYKVSLSFDDAETFRFRAATPAELAALGITPPDNSKQYMYLKLGEDITAPVGLTDEKATIVSGNDGNYLLFEYEEGMTDCHCSFEGNMKAAKDLDHNVEIVVGNVVGNFDYNYIAPPTIEKTPGVYDPETGYIHYVVKIINPSNGGDVTLNKFHDASGTGKQLVKENIKVFGVDSSKYDEPVVNWNTFSIIFKDCVLTPGQTVIIEYDINYGSLPGGVTYANNTAEFTYDEEKNVSTTVSQNFYEWGLEKSGSVGEKTEDGHAKEIVWKIKLVGKGGLDGIELTETLPEGLKVKGDILVYSDSEMKNLHETVTVENASSFNGKNGEFKFKLNDSDTSDKEVYIKIVTEGTFPDGVIADGPYENRVSMSDPGYGPDPSTSTGKVDTTPAGPSEDKDEPKPTPTKSLVGIEGDTITYSVKIAGSIKAKQLPSFYMYDKFGFSYGGNMDVNLRNALDIVSVTTNKGDDITKWFKVVRGDYTLGEGDSTFSTQNFAKNTFVVYDNKAMDPSDPDYGKDPAWVTSNPDDLIEITLVYTINMTKARLMAWNNSGVLEETSTIKEYLEENSGSDVMLANWAYPWGKDAFTNFTVKGHKDFSKEGQVVKGEDGNLYIEYTVTFIDTGKPELMETLVFEDDYDESNVTLDKAYGIKAVVTDTYTGAQYGEFAYAIQAENGNISALWTNFTNSEGNLQNYFNENHSKANRTYTFKYRTQILRTSESRSISNSASIKWNGGGVIGPEEYVVDFESGHIDKQATISSGRIRFTVDVNKYGEDLVKDSNVITLIDDYGANKVQMDDGTKKNAVEIDRNSVYVCVGDNTGWAYQRLDNDQYIEGKTKLDHQYVLSFENDPVLGDIIKIIIPDNAYVKISYEFTVPEDVARLKPIIKIDNKATLYGSATVESGNRWSFSTDSINSSFDISKNKLTLVKLESGTVKPKAIEGAKFLLYAANPPKNIEALNAVADERLYFDRATNTEITEEQYKALADKTNVRKLVPAAVYTTGHTGNLEIIWDFRAGSDWTFALREIAAPDGYELLDEVVYFTMDKDGHVQPLKESASSKILVDGALMTVYDEKNVTEKVTVKKVWNGDVSEDAKVKIGLYAAYDGTNELVSETPVRMVYLPNDSEDETERWTCEFTNLPAVESQHYVVKELEMPEGWELSGTHTDVLPANDGKDKETVYTLTNTKDDKVKITVRKVWENVGEAGKPVDEVKVKLYADGSPYKNGDDEEVVFTLNEENGWKDTIENLPKYQADGETVIEYTVEETTEVDGWETEVTKSPSGDNAYEFTVTNTNTRGSLKIEKNLVVYSEADAESLKDITGKTFTFDITSPNGYKNTVTITGERSVTVDNLKPGTYTVTESSAEVSGYAWSVKGNKVDVVVEVGKTATATVTNTYIEKTNLKVKKVWKQGEGTATEMPEKIVVTLMRKLKGAEGDPVSTEKTVELNARNNWEDSFDDLDKFDKDGNEYEYSVVEEHITGWEANYTTEKDGIKVITNTRELTEIPVEKIWEYNGVDPTKVKMPDFITFTLTKKVDGKVETVSTLKLTAENAVDQYHWKGSFKNLPKYEANGNEIDYDVTETPVTNWKTEKLVGNDGVSYTFTNTPIVGSLSIKKNINVDGLKGEGIPDDFKTKVFTFNVTGPGYNGPVTVTGDGTATLNDLIPGRYLVTEEDADAEGYDWVVSGNGTHVQVEEGKTAEVEITNKYGKIIDIPVEKRWNKNGVADEDINMPKSITFTLKKTVKGETVDNGTLELPKNGAWSGSFTNLPKIDEDGNEISYTVKETDVEGWTSTFTVDENGKYTFTNTKNRPDKGSLVLMKKLEGIESGDAANREFTFHITGPNGYNEYRTIKGNQSIIISGLEPGEYTVEEVISDEVTGEDKVALEGYKWVAEGSGGAKVVKVEAGKSVTAEITNKYEKVIEIPVTKVWDDKDSPNAKMPESITVHLVVNGETQEDKSVNLTKDNGWSGSFKDLPKYDDKGNKIEYDVVETAVNGWKLTDKAYDETNGYTLTNTFELGSLTITKALTVHGKAIADKEFTFDVTGPNGYTAVVTITGANSQTLEGLVPGEYTVTEKNAEVNGYAWKVKGSGVTVEVEGNETTATTVTNTYTELTDIPYNKEWVDDSTDPIENYPEITVKLMRKTAKQDKAEQIGTETLPKTDTEGNKVWNGEFTNLPKYDENGDEYIYTIDEEAVLGWTKSVTGTTITNTRPTTSIDVTKGWYENDGTTAETHPSSITVNVKVEDQTVATAQLPVKDSEGNEVWEYKFDKLPKYDDKGKEINYTVEEVVPKGWTSVVSGTENVEIRNKRDAGIEIPVTKVWDDKNSPNVKMPESITVHLVVNGVTQEDKSVTLTKDNGWSGSFTNLPKYDDEGNEIKYNVVETEVDSWELTDKVYNETTGYTLTNTAKVGDLEIKKSITGLGEGVAARVYTFEVTGPNGYKNTVNITGASTKKLENLAIGEYTVKEVTADDNVAVSGYKWVAEGAHDVTVTVEDGGSAMAEITNKYVELTDIDVTKVWDDKDSPNAKKPDSITVVLKAGDEEVGRQDLTVKNNWSYKFTNLPKYDDEGNAIAYTVEEVNVPGWTSSVSGTTITNTAKVGDLEIKKSITGLGEDVAARVYTFEVTGPNGYKNTVTITGANTKKLENLAIGEYTVKEVTADDNVAVSGYKWVAEGSHDVTVTVEDGGNALAEITNKYVELTDIDVTKVWDDKNSPNVNMPDSITVVLKAGDEEIGRQDLTADNDWSYKFTNLPKYDDEGIEIVYTVEEVNVPGWTSSVSGTTLTNTAKVGDLEIKKSITGLGEDVAARVYTFEVTGPNGYKNTVNITGANTVKLENLAIGEYKVKEVTADDNVAVSGYKWVAEGAHDVTVTVEDGGSALAEITNKYVELTDIDVTKVWDDKDSPNVNMPDSITVNLFANGAHKDSAELTAKNGWSYKFTGLDKYDEAGEEISYTVEEVNVPGWTSSVDGTTITNTLEVGSLTITKALTVHGTAIADKEFVFDVTGPNDYKTEVRITGADSQTLNNLVPGEYTVTERDAKVEGYKWTVSDDGKVKATVVANENAAVTITNTYTEVTSIMIAKEWYFNGSSTAAPAGAEITVSLYADGVPTGMNALISELTNWTGEFTNLDVYAEDGHKISYTVSEVRYQDWTSTVTGSPETGFIIRNSRFYVPTITPIIPETPEVPEVPDTPDTPEIPEIPDRPIEPIIPEIPDLPEVPDIPDQPTIPFREIPDLEVPLVEIKDEQVPLIDIPDLGVPLRAIPATGDNSHTGVWAGISAGSALGIAILAAALMLDSKKSKKRREDAE